MGLCAWFLALGGRGSLVSSGLVLVPLAASQALALGAGPGQGWVGSAGHLGPTDLWSRVAQGQWRCVHL